MFKRNFAFLVIIALTLTSAFAGIDEIAVFNEAVGWTTVEAAKEALPPALVISVIGPGSVWSWVGVSSRNSMINPRLEFQFLRLPSCECRCQIPTACEKRSRNVE